MINVLQKQIGQAAAQVRQVFAGIVARSTAKNLQLKGLDGEVLQEVENIQQVGFASWIPEGSRVVILPLGGKTGRSVVVGSTDAPVMVTVNEGEVCIFDQFGHQILLHKSGIKIIGDVEVEGNVKASGNIDADGDIKAAGNVSDSKGAMQQIRVVYNGHNHGNSSSPNQKM